jgi:antitoxin YefM
VPVDAASKRPGRRWSAPAWLGATNAPSARLSSASACCCYLAPRLGGPLLTWHNFLVILLTMTMLPLGEVKSHLSELVKRVHEHHERVTLMVHGRPSAVLLAIEDLERLEETLAILRDSETVSRLATSDAELARGEAVSAEELAAAMRRRPSSR